MTRFITRLIRHPALIPAIEYGLAVALVAVIVLAAITALGMDVSGRP